MTITEFLLARITEDEHLAAAAGHGCGYLHEHNAGWVEVDLPAAHNSRPGYEMRFIRQFSPDRILAECVRKRRLVEAAESRGDVALLCDLASVYADHVDFQLRWRAA